MCALRIVESKAHWCALQVHLSIRPQGVEAEKAVQPAVQATESPKADKKRKATTAAVEQTQKRQKMASVQALHTEHVTQAVSSSVSQQSAPDATHADTASAMQATTALASPEPDSSVAAVPVNIVTSGTDVPIDQAVAQPDQRQKGKGLNQHALSLEKDSPHTQKAAPNKQIGSHLAEVKEYLVKWKGKSYMHCTWVRHDDVAKLAKQSTGLKSRMRHFLQSNAASQVYLNSYIYAHLQCCISARIQHMPQKTFLSMQQLMLNDTVTANKHCPCQDTVQ